MARLSLEQSIKKQARKEILDSIPAMSEESKKGNVQAFNGLLKAGGIGESGGIKINNNIGIDSRRMGDTQADWKFFQKFRGKLETNLLREALPPPDEGEDSPKATQTVQVAPAKEEPTS